jgi:hypothetical protein
VKTILPPIRYHRGAFHAGTVANVIPNEATLLGTVRSLDYEVNKACRSAWSVWSPVCARPPERGTFEFIQGYPAMVNDAAFTAMPSTASGLTGRAEYCAPPTPQLGGRFCLLLPARSIADVPTRVRNEARGLYMGCIHLASTWTRCPTNRHCGPSPSGMDYVQRGGKHRRCWAHRRYHGICPLQGGG